MPEEFDSDDPLDQPPSFFPENEEFADQQDSELLPVEVRGVYQIADGGPPVVVVSDGNRELPIVIGSFEASAISITLEGVRYDRPLTHDLVKTMMDRLEIVLERVVIDDFWSGTYYAKMFLRQGRQEFEIDARPSDALALAVRFESLIFVASHLLDQPASE